MEGNQGRRRGGKEGPQSLAVSGLTGYGARRGTPFPPQYPKTRDGLGPPHYISPHLRAAPDQDPGARSLLPPHKHSPCLLQTSSLFQAGNG